MLKSLFYTILLVIIISCDNPKLNGHYHLEWGNKSSFQTWNIQNNRMRINDSVCSDRKQICYGMPIKFKGDSIFVPWVDYIHRAKYKIDKKGTILMTTNYNNHYDTLKLTPKENCLNSSVYFKNKVRTKFNLVSLYYNTHGESDFPINSKNELIIGKKEGTPFYILNNKTLKLSSNNTYNINTPINTKDIWIHIDNKVQLKDTLIILEELISKGYKIYFSSKDGKENNEQIILLKKSITQIETSKKSTVINSCEYCEKHPTIKIDSIINFKIYGKDSCLVNNKITDYFQLRNYVVRFLKQNRSTRLNTEIQLKINSNILFEDYLYLLSDIDFVNTELSGTYYRDENDPDQKEILTKQNSRSSKNLNLEFPVRIKEVIKPF
ncbi:hypothetical protein PG911_05700 [Tenacibaculum ovolyticum]|uniref:hypothetical protein n=1 Tax=Tenacibaculum ovolyticum TaxID=104270 RepID=UPI0022F39A39|nr:hypothetical protein [Tenacibaculum ovolyticum]WBX77752.1 hypothetical protein PG911_05700 [Tenacibaculum ovolyticum]